MREEAEREEGRKGEGKLRNLGMVAHAYNPNTREVEAGRF